MNGTKQNRGKIFKLQLKAFSYLTDNFSYSNAKKRKIEDGTTDKGESIFILQDCAR